MITQVIYHCHCPLPEKNCYTRCHHQPRAQGNCASPASLQFPGLGMSWFAHTVDGRNPANLLTWLYIYIYPIIYRVLYIPCGAGFLPSTSIFETLVDLKFAGPWVDEIPTMDSPFFDRRLLRISNHKKQTDTRG